MKNAQKPNNITLHSLIARLRDGRYLIPDFQRDFEWKPWDINLLMRSIFLDYYIGNLLLWKGIPRNFDNLSCQPVYGHGGNGSPEHIVLDGQQRLTAIHYAFLFPNKPLPNRANRFIYYIRVDELMAGNHDDAFEYDTHTKSWHAYLKDHEQQYEDHLFPLPLIGSADMFALPNWLQGYENYWKEAAENYKDTEDEQLATEASHHALQGKEFSALIHGILSEYQISSIELDQDIALDKVCDIFTQINSRGVRLDIFDLLNALLRPKDIKLKKMWHDAEPTLQKIESDRLNVYILMIMSILRQAYCSPKYLYFLIPEVEKPIRHSDGTRSKEILLNSPQEFKDLWIESLKALQDAIEILQHPQEYGAISTKFLPYVSILPAFAAIKSIIADLPPERQLSARRKLRHWYWASVFTKRYSGAVESTCTRDFIDLREWFNNDEAEPALIQELAENFRHIELHKETKKGSSIYNGVFNLLIINGARDWMTGNIPHHAELDDHHIIPSSWARENPTSPPRLINSILNRSPISAKTNRHIISDRLPNEYLGQLIEENGESHVRAIFESHLISPIAFDILRRDQFTLDDFEEFINERQRTIISTIESLLIKERLDLAPNLRELDQKIESCELALRRIISNTLQNDESQLPSHILQKAKERLAAALKKNASLDPQKYISLDAKLEYCDLRELETTIVSKQLWSNFESVFNSKGTFIAKLNQVAELRNAIRHSRTADQVTIKECEAALIWFDQCLK